MSRWNSQLSKVKFVEVDLKDRQSRSRHKSSKSDPMPDTPDSPLSSLTQVARDRKRPMHTRSNPTSRSSSRDPSPVRNLTNLSTLSTKPRSRSTSPATKAKNLGDAFAPISPPQAFSGPHPPVPCSVSLLEPVSLDQHNSFKVEQSSKRKLHRASLSINLGCLDPLEDINELHSFHDKRDRGRSRTNSNSSRQSSPRESITSPRGDNSRWAKLRRKLRMLVFTAKAFGHKFDSGGDHTGSRYETSSPTNIQTNSLTDPNAGLSGGAGPDSVVSNGVAHAQ